MPILSNPRHERFAQELTKGKTGDEAYVLAGYKRNADNASRLKGDERIRRRIAELQGFAAMRARVTVQSLIDEAEEVRAKALEAGQFSPAIAAIKEKGILTGLRIEKLERKTISDAAELTDDELADIARSGGIGAVEASPRPRKPDSVH